MDTVTTSRKNGCMAQYNKSQLKLPNGEEMLKVSVKQDLSNNVSTFKI